MYLMVQLGFVLLEGRVELFVWDEEDEEDEMEEAEWIEDAEEESVGGVWRWQLLCMNEDAGELLVLSHGVRVEEELDGDEDDDEVDEVEEVGADS